MSQQHAQFEEEFQDGPQPSAAYQENYVSPPSVTYTAPVPPQQAYMNMPAQKLQAPVVPTTRQAGTGIGSRVVLAIFSMIFVFCMFVVALIIGGSGSGQGDALFALAVVFAFVFAFVVLIINLIVNLVSLRR